LAAAGEHVTDIASANWHASAALVAHQRQNALFIDMGSTTTDIVPVAGGKIAARGYTDAERLAAGELVYTGLVRGFVMATAVRAPFAGAWSARTSPTWATSIASCKACRRAPTRCRRPTAARRRLAPRARGLPA